jgi:hypothetical protein
VDEPQRRVSIRNAGNTEGPALLALRSKGFRIWLEYSKVDDPSNLWHPYRPDYQAEKDGAYFSATTAVELLGLVALWEVRVDDWRLKPSEPDIGKELMESAKTFDAGGHELPEK